MSETGAHRFFNTLTLTTEENIICLKVPWMICNDEFKTLQTKGPYICVAETRFAVLVNANFCTFVVQFDSFYNSVTFYCHLQCHRREA